MDFSPAMDGGSGAHFSSAKAGCVASAAPLAIVPCCMKRRRESISPPGVRGCHYRSDRNGDRTRKELRRKPWKLVSTRSAPEFVHRQPTVLGVLFFSSRLCPQGMQHYRSRYYLCSRFQHSLASKKPASSTAPSP